MITKLVLKNYRQHRDLTLDFAPGMVALRGVNEAGKSTVLESILFALFGIRACRDSDIATWGEPEKSVKVELHLQLPAGELHIVRSKTGAEARLSDRVVTGQTECTRFVEEQLQLQPGLGPKLMIAAQRAIQGVLDEKGGQSATELIEQLADLDVVDRIVDRIQARFPSGNTKIVEGRIAADENKVAAAKEYNMQLQNGWVMLPSDEVISEQGTLVDELKQQVENLRAALPAAEQERDEAVEVNDARAKVIRKRDIATDNLASLRKQLDNLQAKKPVADVASLDDIAASLESAAASQQLFKTYSNMLTKTAGQKVLFDGSEEQLRQLIRETKAKCDEWAGKVAAAPHEINALEAQIVSASVCGFCDKDVSQFPEIAAKNAATREKIDRLRAEASVAATTRNELADELRRLTGILEVGQPKLSLDSPLFNVDRNVFPARVTWAGDIPEDKTAEVERLNAERDKVVAFNAAFNQFKRQLDNLEEQIEAAALEHADLDAKVAALPACLDTTALSKRVEKLLADIGETARACATAESTLVEMKHKVQQHRDAVAKSKETLLNAELQLAEAREELAEMAFNNALVKKLRLVRPEIANKVWNSVLGAVSHYFSVMRGSKSVVARDGTAFTVDGKAVSSYSGSTVDVLGLALRVALVRTFLPSCRFLLLDEPFSACDDGRQTSALGFLAGAGFDQVLIITHEEISETVANSLVTI